MSVLKMTRDNFEEVVGSAEGKVLLDFWATWCGPCRMIAPFVEEIAEENEDLTVGKIDVDEEPALAARFGITSIPTLIVMEKGEPVASLVGYRPKSDILKVLDL